jgi:SAM-dependent methyltransferase
MFVDFNPKKNSFFVVSSRVAHFSQLSTRWILRTLKETRSYAGGVILDIGCGDRPYEKIFSSEKYIGAEWPQSQHSNTKPDVFMDALDLPFKTGSFDTVVCTEVLEHLPNAGPALQEISRVLKRDGHFILSVPFFYLIHESPHDYYRYTSFGLRKLLEDSHFTVVRMDPRGGGLTVAVDCVSRMLSMYVSWLLKKLHFPEKLISPIRYGLFAYPQILFARALFFCYDHFPRLAALLDNAERTTLGYVAVAKRK